MSLFADPYAIKPGDEIEINDGETVRVGRSLVSASVGDMLTASNIVFLADAVAVPPITYTVTTNTPLNAGDVRVRGGATLNVQGVNNVAAAGVLDGVPLGFDWITHRGVWTLNETTQNLTISTSAARPATGTLAIPAQVSLLRVPATIEVGGQCDCQIFVRNQNGEFNGSPIISERLDAIGSRVNNLIDVSSLLGGRSWKIVFLTGNIGGPPKQYTIHGEVILNYA